MTDLATLDDYGVLAEPATLKIQRLLPGPVDRIWDYLVRSDLRRKWLAGGEMTGVGGTVELVWRNDELSDTPSQRPETFPEEHRLVSEITEFDPPRRLAFTWGSTGGVSIELEPKGQDVLLTLVHRRLGDRSTMLNVSAGWHAHLDVLADRLRGQAPGAFWPKWAELKAEYDRRLPV
jgi:uncharacterized protein YndB with AHSA1/START domain